MNKLDNIVISVAFVASLVAGHATAAGDATPGNLDGECPCLIDLA